MNVGGPLLFVSEGMAKSVGLWLQTVWVGLLALLLPYCVTLARSSTSLEKAEKNAAFCL